MTAFCLRLPEDLERASHALDVSDDYRVLRRLPRIDEIRVTASAINPVRLALIDTETTGLDPRTDALIELAASVLTVGADGNICDMEEARSWLEEPGILLTEEVTRITGLHDADLMGQKFDDQAIASLLNSCDVLVSHNARFDRAFVARRFPALVSRPWACTINDIKWSAAGFGSRSLPHLLAEMGYFYSAHRAAPDCWALLCLLAARAVDGRAYAAHLVDSVRKPSMRIFAQRAPYGVKDRLKARGYRWDAEKRCWWLDVNLAMQEAECTWLRELAGCIVPLVECVTAYERYGGG